MVEYEKVSLFSRPGIIVEMIKGCREKAEKLIDLALNDRKRLISDEIIDEHPYLLNPGILLKLNRLISEKDSEKRKVLEDKILLRIGVDRNSEYLSSTEKGDLKKSWEMDAELKSVYYTLDASH